MKIIYFTRNAIHLYPPCINQICYLNDLNIEVLVCFGECAENVKSIFKKRNIRYIDLNTKRSCKGILGKIESFMRYKKAVKSILEKEMNKDDILWFGTVDSAFSVANLLKSKKYVLSILELYDENNFYRKNIGKIIKDSLAVIACESNRAAIMKCWWNLKEKPFVMPNKPYFHPEKLRVKGSEELTKKSIEKIDGKKIILYQGIISTDRDLGTLAEALELLNEDVYLVLLGNEINSSADKIKKIYSKTIYLGYIPAPLHLELTSYATIGIANYDDSCLNNIYCAPNKIYEYGGFGLPILCSDVPGLEYTVGAYKAGICCNFKDINEIKEGLEKILSNYKEYSDNAKKMFNSIDNQFVMKKIVKKIKEHN